MIPTTIQQLALMIYMMEINEWGVDSNEKLCTKLANESFAAAKAFFDVAQKRSEPEQRQLEITHSKFPKGTKSRKIRPSDLIRAIEQTPGVTAVGTGVPKPMTESKEVGYSKEPAQEVSYSKSNDSAS